MALAFWPAVRNGWTNYDDDLYVTANPRVQAGLTAGTLRWAWRGAVAANWHPLTVLSHALDCQLFGLKPAGHHATSVLLHALNTALVFWVLRRMTGAAGPSVFAAALFGLHPLRVESVAWIAERKDVLSGVFWMLTLWAYARYAETAGTQRPAARRWYGLALAAFVLGLMSKPMLVTLPFVLLLLDYWPLNRFRDRRGWLLAAEKAPFFALAAASSVVTFLVQQSARSVVRLEAAPLALRLGNAVLAYVRYLGQFVWPDRLAVLYPFPRHLAPESVLLAGLLLLGITAAAVALRRRHPYLPVGWFWYLGTLVPVIGVVQVGQQAMADRYTYVPLLGIHILLAWGAVAATRSWRRQTPVLAAASAAVLLFCVPLTYRQLGYWANAETLFRRAAAVTRDNYVAHNNLAMALFDAGRLDESLSESRRALALKADYPEARNNLGAALLGQGRAEEAIRELQPALASAPDSVQTRKNLAVAWLRLGNLDAAIPHLQAAVRLEPRDAGLRDNLGVALARRGRRDDAIREFREALTLNPDSAEAHNNLAVTLLGKGHLDEAAAHLQTALRLKPGYAEACNNLGLTLQRQGRPAEAARQFEAALALRPDYAEARRNLEAARRPPTPVPIPAPGVTQTPADP